MIDGATVTVTGDLRRALKALKRQCENAGLFREMRAVRSEGRGLR